METWDAVRARRNIRTYRPEPLEAAHLERILEAGRRAPSSRNEQRWDFVAVTDWNRLQALSRVWRGAGHIANAAAAIALVVPDEPDRHIWGSIQYDLGQTAMLMMVTAADLGIGAGHAHVEDKELIREILDLPSGRTCTHMIGLGFPGDRPLRPVKDPARRPFDDVVHRERW